MQLEGVQPSLAGLFRLRMFSQDYVLGYFQPSLWDWAVALVNGGAIDLRQRSDLRVYAVKAVVGLRPSFSAHVRFGERWGTRRFPPTLLWNGLPRDLRVSRHSCAARLMRLVRV
jgi:hypothetical protein